jgi:hypothetical protein
MSENPYFYTYVLKILKLLILEVKVYSYVR